MVEFQSVHARRAAHLGQGHVGMRLSVFGQAGVALVHLAWLLPTDGLRGVAGDCLPGDLLVNAAGYVYYVALSEAFRPCGHIADPGCFRRVLSHLKRDEASLFDVTGLQQTELEETIGRQAREWVGSHEGQASYPTFARATQLWRQRLGNCHCDEFCVCLYRFPCPACGTPFTTLGEYMQEVTDREGRCPACSAGAPPAPGGTVKND
jgi:hypothetical protein